MRKRVATLVAVATMLAGCGGGVEGSPVAAERWDPCSIPDEAIAATGLDPATKDEGWGEGIEVDDWALCTYKAAAYYLTVKSSSTRTIDEVRENSSNLEGRDVQVGERDTYQYKTSVGRFGRTCNVAVGMRPGVIVFSVIDMADLDGDRLCELVIQHTNELQDALPNAK